MAVINLTELTFADAVAVGNTVIIDFWAPWCGPCQAFGPVFEAAAEAHPEVIFAKVNTEEQQSFATAFNIRSIPTLMIFRDEVMLYREAGAVSAAHLDLLIQRVNEIDMDKVHAELARQASEPDAPN